MCIRDRLSTLCFKFMQLCQYDVNVSASSLLHVNKYGLTNKHAGGCECVCMLKRVGYTFSVASYAEII